MGFYYDLHHSQLAVLHLIPYCHSAIFIWIPFAVLLSAHEQKMAKWQNGEWVLKININNNDYNHLWTIIQSILHPMMPISFNMYQYLSRYCICVHCILANIDSYWKILISSDAELTALSSINRYNHY